MHNANNTIFIFDTTLRDGEQAPGASMTIDQKLEIARSLAKMNVDVIEAGFPVSSDVQFEATKRIAEEIEGAAICALSRAVKNDIDSATNALKAAKKSRLHTFIATSDIHIKKKFNKRPSEILAMAVEAVRYAKGFFDDVEFSAEDASRSNLDYLSEVIEAVIDAGATVVNIPDTVGYAIPEEYANIIMHLKKNVRNIDKAIISVHCHDDLGLATANSLAAAQAGARQIECTVNGIGERAGNAAMEEIVMALSVRKDFFKGLRSSVKTDEIYRVSRMVAGFAAFPVAPNKAIVGKNAFAHESGIHQDGMLKARETYEIMTPESIGREESTLVMGRHTGRAGFAQKTKALGYALSDEQTAAAYERFKHIADLKKEVYDDDIVSIIQDEFNVVADWYSLEYLQVMSGNVMKPTSIAAVKLAKKGVIYTETGSGGGPIDAVFNAIDTIAGVKASLADYDVKAVTEGQDALGEATVVIAINNERYIGRGASTDVVEASAKAYLNAVNKYLQDEGKPRGEHGAI